MTLLRIVTAALAGGVLSTATAAATLGLRVTWIPRFVSFAVGALLGAVFLELLPDALERGPPAPVMLTVVIGLLAFFVLGKLVLWRHAPQVEGRPGLMILVDNGVHSFCDGIGIATMHLLLEP